MKPAKEIAQNLWVDIYDQNAKNATARIETTLVNFAKEHRKEREKYLVQKMINLLGIDHITISQIKSLIMNDC